MSLFYEPILPHVPVFLAALSRLSGLFIFAPVISSPMIPSKAKAFLAIALTIAVYPTLNLHANVPLRLDLLELAPAMATEALIGITIGLIAAAPLVAVQMGGLLMGQQMGLGLASLYNPATDNESDAISQLLFFLAMGVFLAAGGLDAMVRAVILSFAHLPIGAFSASDTPLALLSGLVSSGFELAVRVAAPVLCLLSVETVTSALLMKTAPQMNVMSFGFPLRITLGLGAMYASLGAVQEVSNEDVGSSLRLMLEWAGSIGAGAAGGS